MRHLINYMAELANKGQKKREFLWENTCISQFFLLPLHCISKECIWDKGNHGEHKKNTMRYQPEPLFTNY